MEYSGAVTLPARILFVADTAFVAPERVRECNLVSIFPQAPGDGAYRESYDGLVRRSKLQSAYYDELLPQLAPILSRHLGAHGRHGIPLIRLTLIAITTLFADRCLRLLHRIKQRDRVNIGVVAVDPVPEIHWLSQLKNGANSSWQLNQDIVQRLAAALGLESAFCFEKDEYPEFPRDDPVTNALFVQNLGGWRAFARKIAYRFGLLLSRLPSPQKNFLAFGFAYDDYFAIRRGLYSPWGIFQRMSMDALIKAGTRNPRLRTQLRVDAEPVMRRHFMSLMQALDSKISADELTAIGGAYVSAFFDWLPTGFLEGFEDNLETCIAVVGSSGSKAIIGSQLDSDAGHYLGAAAHATGKRVIGVQHGGGHLGYIEDMSINGQLEFPQYDEMVSWGWREIDLHFPVCRTIPLPCPRYSERPLRSDYLANVRMHGKSMHDVLFLSNTFHRFPHISTSGQSRVDFIDEITASQQKLMRALDRAGISVDHKPYNMRFTKLYPIHYRRIAEAGGSGYRLLESRQKGLTVELIKSCKIVLWDQLGSGAVEGLVSGVPTIIFWDRIYSRELQCARELVAGLERCGVVHSNAEALADEIKAYLQNPESWMSNPRRVEAIKLFCHMFARTDPSWQKVWRRQLAEVPV